MAVHRPTKSLTTKFLRGLFSSSSASISGPMKLPLEVLENIIDQADRRTLLTLSLVSHNILFRSRIRIFGTLRFVADDKQRGLDDPNWALNGRQLDRLLSLLRKRKNTISYSVRIMAIENLFAKQTHKFKRRDKVHLLASTLSGLTNFRMDSIIWEHIPRRIIPFFMALPPVKVELGYIQFYNMASFLYLFKSPMLARASHQLSLDGLYVHQYGVYNPAPHLPTFPHQIHFISLDASSLIEFHGLWDLDKAQITVDTFLVSDRVHNTYVPFFTSFLAHIGLNLKSLFVSLHENSHLDGNGLFAVDFSSCTTLRVLYMGIFYIDDRQPRCMDEMWTVLKRVPVFTIETIGILINACMRPWIYVENELRIFPWIDIVLRLKDNFPSLKKIRFVVGDYHLGTPSVMKSVAQEFHLIVETAIQVSFEPQAMDGRESGFLWGDISQRIQTELAD